MESTPQIELHRSIVSPVSASFMVLDDMVPSDDSDEDDLDRYNVGLREQLFITLSRAIRSTQNMEQKITESALHDSMKTKRGPQNRNASINLNIPPPPPLPKVIQRYKHSYNGIDKSRIKNETKYNRMRTQSISRYKGRYREDDHIVLNCINHKTLHNEDFIHLHQHFSQEFANKIFDGHLKSYQRTFIPISRQRNGYTLHHKSFINKIESSMDITNKERDRVIKEYIYIECETDNKSKWQKLLGKMRKHKTSLTLDDPDDIMTLKQRHHHTKTKDDMMINAFDYDDAMYKTDFKINEITDSIHSSQLKRGDIIFIMEYIDCAKHCMIVLQNIGYSIEIAHVTQSHGGIRSFIHENTVNAYRCVVYRLSNDDRLSNEAANVAENLVAGGRVLCNYNIEYTENPEKYFYRFLLNSSESLFRRMVRLKFDEGNHFFNLSSSEFVALCYQRALVNKRSFDRELIRLLDFCPHLTPPPLLQKYLHLNIDEHRDWKCLGNVFFSYL